MVWYKRLRWRLLGIQLLVVVIGITSVLLATRLLLLRTADEVIRPNLQPYIDSPATLQTIEEAILTAFRNAVNLSLLLAGFGAVVAGFLASYLLWRTLVTPLRKIASSSQRIADGHYAERVAVPDGGGEALQQLVTNFNQMAVWLETTEQKRSAMVGNVAHELRTPLAGLRGMIEGIEDGIYAPDRETFQQVAKELDRLTRMINDLQDLSRSEAGAVQLHFHDFAIWKVVQNVLTHLAPQADAGGVELLKQPPEQPLLVHADSDRTVQVLTNLISNAIRYTPEGGSITVSLVPQGRSVHIRIKDTGVGIAADELSLVFERFYRVDASRSRASGGSGVGLTIARHLAWAMGGEISAESAGVHQGSTFTFTLPLATTD